MKNFLINMAIIKVNWDESRKDILDNYLPLVGYAVKCCDGDIIALEDVEAKLREITDFKIPRGAIITMLKRATKPMYQYVKKQELKYVKVPENLAKLNYERTRNEQTRRFNALKEAFRTFCLEKYIVTITEEEVDEYFFDILYDIAPSLYKNLQISDSETSTESYPGITKKFLVSRFIQHVVNNDPTSFAALEAFVRGAMLTETFYYSSPDDIPRKFRSTTVYFDTSFLLRLLGYSSEEYNRPCKELHEMLSAMGVRMKCFKKTFDEIHRILYAASRQLESGRAIPTRPGSVADYFIQSKYSSSDVEYECATLDEKLRTRRIDISEHPIHETSLTIDEKKLDEYISSFIEWQNERARNHDIDCLTSIFRLRGGRLQKYLESCEAIFVTTNSSLARASTKFFNSEYGISDAPICMSDQVFTTFVWLKAVNKLPDLPKERLVANCYAALNPSEELWQKYLKEVNKLLKEKRIREQDCDVLVHSLEARRRLMDITLGDERVCVEGTVEDVLKAAKEHYLAEAADEVRNTRVQYSILTERIDDYVQRSAVRIREITYWGILIILFVVIALALLMTAPSDVSKLLHITKLDAKDFIKGIAFIIVVTLTSLCIVFGLILCNPVRWLSDRISRLVSDKIRNKFYSNQKTVQNNEKESSRSSSWRRY